jgi:hypothetical protein
VAKKVATSQAYSDVFCSHAKSGLLVISYVGYPNVFRNTVVLIVPFPSDPVFMRNSECLSTPNVFFLLRQAYRYTIVLLVCLNMRAIRA